PSDTRACFAHYGPTSERVNGIFQRGRKRTAHSGRHQSICEGLELGISSARAGVAATPEGLFHGRGADGPAGRLRTGVNSC
ncbi:MAG: hypothetical protein OXJ64_17475, partial [Boseongicola sp.]|nr:hypothetical protein [Boseongicola sp.]